MPIELIWHPQARADMLDIYVSIGLENPAAAERVYKTLEARAWQLTDHPRLGPRRADIRPSMRMLVEGPHLILYETQPDTDSGPVAQIILTRVVDGRRDLAHIL